MTNFRADLHCHTTCSDGTVTPKEIISLAVQSGLSGLSITDHDTIEAYQTATRYAQEKGIELIPGVEFSTSHAGESVHILGYAFSLKSDAIHALCAKHKERRIQRYRAILDKLAQHKMPISEGELLSLHPQGSIGRPHIALVMMQKGYVTSVDQAFKKFLGEGRSCYTKGYAFPVEETIDVIHAGGGLAVIAHPHLIRNGSITRDLLKMPFDGIEGYYAKFPPSEEKKWIAIGNEKGWLVTGGSDFHGTVKPHLPLGCSWVGEDTFQLLREHYAKVS